MSARNSCKGYCCESFLLTNSQLSLEELIELSIFSSDPEARAVTGMLVPLGYYNRNPLRVVRGDKAGDVVELDPAAFEGAWFYTCNKFDRDSRSCNDYVARPHMCREFPNEGPCPFEGCDYVVPYRMISSQYWEGLQVSRGLFRAECADLAYALGVPEPRPTPMEL